MAIKTKAVGIRFPLDLIERIEKYQYEQETNFTEALISLVKKGLGGDEIEAIETSNDKLDRRITNILEAKLDVMLDERITNIMKAKLDAMLDERITNIMEAKLDAMLDERITESPRHLSDTELDVMLDKNIPSDDSSNFESIAEDVQNIQTNQIGEVPTSFSFAGFHDWLGLPRVTRNKANGNIATKVAREQSKGNWAMDSSSYRFTNLTEE